eukprot:scaffold38661_cov61-Phaeocystis_antarctica.AAC.1
MGAPRVAAKQCIPHSPAPSAAALSRAAVRATRVQRKESITPSAAPIPTPTGSEARCSARSRSWIAKGCDIGNFGQPPQHPRSPSSPTRGGGAEPAEAAVGGRTGCCGLGHNFTTLPLHLTGRVLHDVHQAEDDAEHRAHGDGARKAGDHLRRAVHLRRCAVGRDPHAAGRPHVDQVDQRDGDLDSQTQRDQRFRRHLREPLELQGWAQSAVALPWSPVGRHAQAGGCLEL